MHVVRIHLVRHHGSDGAGLEIFLDSGGNAAACSWKSMLPPTISWYVRSRRTPRSSNRQTALCAVRSGGADLRRYRRRRSAHQRHWNFCHPCRWRTCGGGSASNASPPTISSAIITSVGRCHCAAITDNPTSTVYAQPITATSARSTRGTSTQHHATRQGMTCPEGVELPGFDSKLIRYGRGSSGFNSSAAAKHSLPNTSELRWSTATACARSDGKAIAPMMTR